MRRSVFFLLTIIILITAFWLRVADLNTLPIGLHFDEAENLQRAWRLISGYGLMPNFEGIPEPFDAHIRAAFLAFVGISPFAGRLFSGFLGVLGVGAVIALARALYWNHPRRDMIVLTAGLVLASLPPYVIIGRAIYASNWIPLTSTLALTALLWAWRTNRLRYFVLTSIFTALTVTFYLAGIAFPAALIVCIGLLMLARRFRWPGRRSLIALFAAFGITLLPWLYLFVRIPGWLAQRIEALTIQNFNPLASPGSLLYQIGQAFQPIAIPDTVPFPVYNPYTAAFLNPALVVLLITGLLATVWRWRKLEHLIPLAVFAVMIAPNILSNRPEQPVRMVGIYAPLSLLVGLGAGEFIQLLYVRSIWLGRAALVVLAGVLVWTPINTHAHIWYHFREQPRLWSDPTDVRSWAYLFGVGYEDMLRQLAESSQPIYIPVDYLNTNRAAGLLRPFMTVNAEIDGDILPAGLLFHPDKSITYGFPEVDLTRPALQYALVLPESQQITILPPLSLIDAQALEAQIQSDGRDLATTQGWVIGKQLDVMAESNPFIAQQAVSNSPLAIFDNRLELLQIDAPSELTPGEWIPITLYWRLKERTGEDYFVRLQTWDYADTSRGTQRDLDGLILRYLFPTVMWQVGQIVAETRWVQVFEDAPSGGYRFAISVSTYPGPTAKSYQVMAGGSNGEWALVGQSSITSEQFTMSTNQPAQAMDVQFGESIRLTGITFDPLLNELHAGESVTLHLFWEADQPVTESYTLFLHLWDGMDNQIDQRDVIPFDGQYPTWAWQTSDMIETTYTLTAPEDSTAPYRLLLGWYQYPSLERLPAFLDGQSQPDNLIVFP
ncbi:MAG: hypothetical protein K8L97_31330 [Anaerolineae bacterium]|nr:hypothetical protein [Anaerolineae bacterium]